MNLENKYQLIDEYLDKSMDQGDIDKFKAFMQSDADLVADIQILEEMGEMTAFQSAENNLRDSLTNIRTEKLNAKPATSNYKSLFIGLAALLFIGLSYFAYKSLNTSNESQILQQYASIEPLELTTKSAEAVYEIREMQVLYNKGEYEKALIPINKYLAAYPNDLDVLLAKGVALYKTESYTDAQLVFKAIDDLNPRVAKYKWHSAIAYLKAGDHDSAKTTLNQIVSNKTYNYEDAKEILLNLK